MELLSLRKQILDRFMKTQYKCSIGTKKKVKWILKLFGKVIECKPRNLVKLLQMSAHHLVIKRSFLTVDKVGNSKCG